MESILYIIIRGFAVGLLISAPMGPIGVLCIKRTLDRGRWAGFYTGVGAALSDLIYCLLTGLGLSFITDFVETLSWEYLCYVREHPIKWSIPTYILYGENDNLTSKETISKFSEQIFATLTIMEGGEHWFHTETQMKFLDDWIIKLIR